MAEPVRWFRHQVGSNRDSSCDPDTPHGVTASFEFRASLSAAVGAALEVLSTQKLAALPFGGMVYVSISSLDRMPCVDDIIILYSRQQLPHFVPFLDGRTIEFVASFSYALPEMPVDGAGDWEVEANEHPFLLDFLLLSRSQLVALLVPYAQAMAMDFGKPAMRMSAIDK